MDAEEELPADVIAAIREGRKIAAIKLLIEQGETDLRRAKERVEAYMAAHPVSPAKRAQQGGPRLIPLVLAIAVTVLAYLAVRYLG